MRISFMLTCIKICGFDVAENSGSTFALGSGQRLQRSTSEPEMTRNGLTAPFEVMAPQITREGAYAPRHL